MAIINFIGGGGSGGGGSGTVTTVATGAGLTGGPVTTAGTISANETTNAQTGTTYSVVIGDKGQLVTFSNASSIAVTLAASSNVSGFFADLVNEGVGTVVITPSSGTIDGAATLQLTTGQGVHLVSDGTNYFTVKGVSSSNSLTFVARTGTVTETATNEFIEATGPATITLVTPVGNTGKQYYITKADSSSGVTANYILINPGAGTINGASQFQLQVQYDAVNLISDGTNWVVNAQFGAKAPTITPSTSGTFNATTTGQDIITPTLTGALAVVLPAASSLSGQGYVIKKADASAFAVTITDTGGATIDGSASYVLSTQNQSVILRSNGTNWNVIATTGTAGATTKFYVQQAIAVGANTITHNLALAVPKALVMFITDNATGSQVTVPITTYATNSIVITAVSSVATANITIIG